MKIAIVGPAYPYRGGFTAYNHRLARALKKSGHEVKIVTFSMQYPAVLFPGKTQYLDESPPDDLDIVRLINSANPLNWFLTGKRLRNESFDLIIIRYWLPYMGPAFGTILRMVDRKDTKVICIADNIIPHEKRIGDKAFTKYFVKSVDGFLVMSDAVRQDLKLFTQDKPVVLTPHPVYDHFGEDIPRREALRKLGLDSSKKYVLFFGLIRAYKGLDLLLEAMARPQVSKDIHLIVAGEFYDDQKKYMDIIAKYQMKDRIHIHDRYIRDEDVKYYFGAADLIAQTYKSATQSGVTQIAYHFEKPMVVTNVGGLPEMCPDGKAGYVVEPNPSQIADAIVKYFDHADSKVLQEGIREEKKKYSWEILVEKLMDLKKAIDYGQNI